MKTVRPPRRFSLTVAVFKTYSGHCWRSSRAEAHGNPFPLLWHNLRRISRLSGSYCSRFNSNSRSSSLQQSLLLYGVDSC